MRFVTWDLLITFAEEIRLLLFKLISHPKLMEKPIIIDPFDDLK